MDAIWSAAHAGWKARHRYVDLTSGAPKPALNEEWTTRVYALGAGPANHSRVRRGGSADGSHIDAARVARIYYGGMAVCGAASFMGAPTNEIVLTSEGKDRQAADNTRARWAHISGRVDGLVAGIAMLGYPDNFVR